MTATESTTDTPPLPPGMPTPSKRDHAGALLSFLIPGLGQLVQGRTSKGLLFLFSVYSLFFYGMMLGQWHNVYYADTMSPQQADWKMPRWLVNLYNRPQFAGQFWVGIAAWPAIYHYLNDAPTESLDHREFIKKIDQEPWLRRFMVALPEADLNNLQRDSDKQWDLGWVFTVIAGVLNVLVIYDAWTGPAFVGDPHKESKS